MTVRCSLLSTLPAPTPGPVPTPPAAHKASLLAACAALGLAATSKREAFDALKEHFVDGPRRAAAEARAAVQENAWATFNRAQASFDDVEKEELLEACATLGLTCTPSKREAFNTLQRAKKIVSDGYTLRHAEETMLSGKSSCSGCKSCGTCDDSFCGWGVFCDMCR